MENILITGGAGFIGSNFLHLMMKKHPELNIVNVDALTYAGCYENIRELDSFPNYTFVHESICNKSKMEDIMQSFDIDTVINFAAESHVDRSINDSDVFYETNVMGTKALLDAAISNWKLDKISNNDRGFKPGVKFLQISTDEVYGSLDKNGYFKESTPLHPNSPYSASKASADLLVQAYNHTYGIPVNITRCSNNYGPFQFPEKLIPLMITNALKGEKLPVYGDGQQIRDWLHVTDHCEAILKVLMEGRGGQIYNIGGDSERANIDVVKTILDTLGKDYGKIDYVEDRPGHDRRYAIDHTKISNELGWRPSISFERGIRETVAFYQEHVLEKDKEIV